MCIPARGRARQRTRSAPHSIAVWCDSCILRGSGLAVRVRSLRVPDSRGGGQAMRLRAALSIVTGLLLVGCYNYLPLRRSSLVPSNYLAVTLTESGSEELARYLGPNALVVRGRYLAATDRGLALSVDAV